uniref:Uncharacterized protein n=1 Tax=Mesocestoides corti TaxID=53468 RepID=A0A5K3EMR0_MESCO
MTDPGYGRPQHLDFRPPPPSFPTPRRGLSHQMLREGPRVRLVNALRSLGAAGDAAAITIDFQMLNSDSSFTCPPSKSLDRGYIRYKTYWQGKPQSCLLVYR